MVHAQELANRTLTSLCMASRDLHLTGATGNEVKKNRQTDRDIQTDKKLELGSLQAVLEWRNLNVF